MPDKILNLPLDLDFNQLLSFFSSPNFKTLQLVAVVYGGLLWLSIIIWVTRDAINRSNSLLFQVFAILLNIFFPVLGVLLYLIVRPSKTTLERYYEELEHRLILESINEKAPAEKNETVSGITPLKMNRKKMTRKSIKKTELHPVGLSAEETDILKS